MTDPPRRRPQALRGAAALGATIAVTATAIVGVIALMGADRLPVAEHLLFPGSMAAWLYKGDNFESSRQFLAHAIAFGIPINALAGAVLGALTAALMRLLRSR